MEKDRRVTDAVAHWQNRFVSNGVPLADFHDVAAAVADWSQWCDAWSARGALHERLGRQAIAEQRFLSAGEHLTTAAVCYHFGKFLFVHDQSAMQAAHQRAIKCRTDALPHLDPPGERIEIPWDGITLKGNLRKPLGITRPPVVLMAMGLDSAKEEMDSNERVFLDRGMATLAFDGPGQGEAEYDRPICPEYEEPVGAVLDYLETRPDVDASRVGIWGVSLGGYYAPRAAAYEKRLKACIALSGPFDWGISFEIVPPLTKAAFVARSHSTDDAAAYAVARRMTLAEAAPRITCPIYIVGAKLDRIVAVADAEHLARTVAGPVILNMIDDATHVANNRIYRYRPQSADWMAVQLALD